MVRKYDFLDSIQKYVCFLTWKTRSRYKDRKKRSNAEIERERDYFCPQTPNPYI